GRGSRSASIVRSCRRRSCVANEDGRTLAPRAAGGRPGGGMKTHNAFFAGVAGGVAMSLLATLARARGIPVNTEILLGTFPGGAPGPSEWMSGFVVTLLIAGVVGLAYGQGFELVAPHGGLRAGLAFGFVHAICGGVLLEATTLIHPLVPDRLPDAGTFLGNFGP